jgi:hypothetical protein
MSDDFLEPKSIKDLEDPAFLSYVDERCGCPMHPDPEDYDRDAEPRTDEEVVALYREALAGKLLRLYHEWKVYQLERFRRSCRDGSRAVGEPRARAKGKRRKN